MILQFVRFASVPAEESRMWFILSLAPGLGLNSTLLGVWLSKVTQNVEKETGGTLSDQ